MRETNSEMPSPEAEENFEMGTSARTRPLSYEEIVERRKNKHEVPDSTKEPSISTEYDGDSNYRPPSRSRTEGWRLASMVVSSKAEEEFESMEVDQESDRVRDGVRNVISTLKRSDMRKGNRYKETRDKRGRSTSSDRHVRDIRERESHIRERSRGERELNRREPPPERRNNRRDLPPPSPDRKTDRRRPAQVTEKRSDKRNQPRSPERKSDRISHPSSPERKPSGRNHPHSRSPERRPEKVDQSHPRRYSHSEKKYDRLDHPQSHSQERKSEKQDQVIQHSLESRSDRRDLSRNHSPERRPDKRDHPHSRSPGRRPQRDRPRSRSPGRKPEKRHQPRSRSPLRRTEKRHQPRPSSPQRRSEKRDHSHSRSQENRPEKRSRHRSRSTGRRAEQDRPRSRSPERRSDKREQPHSRSPGRKSDKRERRRSRSLSGSPEKKSDTRNLHEKKPDKLVHQDKDNIVENSSSRPDKPQIPSVEKKSDKWDKPPSGVSVPDQPGLGSIIGAFQTTIQNMLDTGTISTMVEPVQLTQATRPRRRLYIDDIPDLVSEKTLVDEINAFFPETNPCLTCTINKEKRQALVEFLTPDDATKALSFDGTLFLGTALKLRRPKDYVEMPNVVPEKPVEEVKAISDVVKNSRHKIFIAGINSELLSSKELMEIVSVWGPLKAYHFMQSEELGEPCAFLEYEDHSVTLNACAGLNGMMIGTRTLTVVQALPDASDEALDEKSPSYEVPLHAKPLLIEATRILQLTNMYDRDVFLELSKSEIEEDIEDIRLTCSRFGTVKSVKIVPYVKPNAPKETSDTTIIAKDIGMDDTSDVRENGLDETENAAPSPLASSTGDEYITDVDQGTIIKEESAEQEKALVSEIATGEKSDERHDASDGETVHIGDVPNGMQMEKGKSEDIFPVGSVLVEFVRKEAACMAAHELHGELFGGRVVEASYAPLDPFLDRFSTN